MTARRSIAYKLQEYAGLPRRKRSAGKATWPGRKQVWRHYGPDGHMADDVLSSEDDTQEGEKLIRPFMSSGKRIGPMPTLAAAKAHAAAELARLPEALRRLERDSTYPVRVSHALVTLAAEVDERVDRRSRKND